MEQLSALAVWQSCPSTDLGHDGISLDSGDDVLCSSPFTVAVLVPARFWMRASRVIQANGVEHFLEDDNSNIVMKLAQSDLWCCGPYNKLFFGGR